MEIDPRDLILKVFRCNSLLEEVSLLMIKESLCGLVREYDLPIDFFDTYIQTLADKKYILSEIAQELSLPLAEILKTLKNLQKIIEGCFAENNLKNNAKLRSLINESPDGYIPLSTFLKYKNVKSLTSSELFLIKALEDSGVLEISPDRHSVRQVGLTRPQDQDAQVFYYNLDTSQTQITYSSISEGVLLKPTIIAKIKNITMVAGNSRVVCYFRPDFVHRVDLATNEDRIISQAKGLCHLEIKNDEDLLVGVIDKIRIIVVNLQAIQQIFDYKVTEGQVDKVVFHPTEKNMLGRFYNTEVVLFRYSPGKMNEVNWFKVVPFKLKILNIALIKNLLAVSVGQGQIVIINTDTDMTVASYYPHTYNTMMYSSNITLHFINPNFLLTSGRSQNEYCLTKIDSKEKSHSLSVQSLSKKHLSVFGDCLLITDPLSSCLSIVIISDIDGMLKFSKIIDYKLDTNCLLAHLISNGNFVVASKNDFRAYHIHIPTKIEEKVTENSIEADEMINTINSFLNTKNKILFDNINNLAKLNTLKKGLQDCICENIEKVQAKDQKAIHEDIKKYLGEIIFKAFNAAIEEMMEQTYLGVESGIKEFQDKESELDTVYDYLHKENYSKITLITDFTDLYSKSCMRKVKKLEKVEESFREKLLTLKNMESWGIQEKINILLAQGDFETALSMVILYPNKLFSTLTVINPYGLFQSKKISASLHNKILKQFLVFPPTTAQLINSAEWLECLLKFKTWTATEKEQSKNLLKIHPLGYLISVIK
jgi:hypothetical protein